MDIDISAVAILSKDEDGNKDVTEPVVAGHEDGELEEETTSAPLKGSAPAVNPAEKHMWNIAEEDYASTAVKNTRQLMTYNDTTMFQDDTAVMRQQQRGGGGGGGGRRNNQRGQQQQRNRRNNDEHLHREPVALYHDNKTIEKRRARAKRFSLPEISFEQDQTDAQHREDLLKTMDIPHDTSEYCYNSVHIVGVDNMSTDDIYEYLRGYEPRRIAWINDTSCNLIYSSVSLACQTLSEMSDPIVACDTEDKVAQDNTSVVQESPTSPTTATASDAISDKEKDAEAHVHNNVEVNSPTHPKIISDGEDDDDIVMDYNEDIEPDTELTRIKIEPVDDVAVEEAAAEEEGDANTEEAVEATAAASSPKSEMEEGELGTDDEEADEGVITATSDITEVDRWRGYRKGHSCDSADKVIYFRFMKHSDVKGKGAESKSDYYVRFGNPNYGGITGYLTKGLKKRLNNGEYVDASGDAAIPDFEDDSQAPLYLISKAKEMEEILDRNNEDDEDTSGQSDNQGKSSSLAEKIMNLRRKRMDNNVAASRIYKQSLKGEEKNSTKWEKNYDRERNGGGDGMRDARSTILKRRTDGDSLKRRRRGYSSDRYHGNSDAAYTSDSDNVDYNNYPRYIIDFLGKRVLANSSMQMSNVSIKKEPNSEDDRPSTARGQTYREGRTEVASSRQQEDTYRSRRDRSPVPHKRRVIMGNNNQPIAAEVRVKREPLSPAPRDSAPRSAPPKRVLTVIRKDTSERDYTPRSPSPSPTPPPPSSNYRYGNRRDRSRSPLARRRRNRSPRPSSRSRIHMDARDLIRNRRNHNERMRSTVTMVVNVNPPRQRSRRRPRSPSMSPSSSDSSSSSSDTGSSSSSSGSSSSSSESDDSDADSDSSSSSYTSSASSASSASSTFSLN